MRRIVLAMLLAVLPPVAMAQTASRPAWIDSEGRRLQYPDHEYFTGFAQGLIGKGETVASTIDRLTSTARADAASRIQVRVKSETSDAVRSIQKQTDEAFDETIVHLYQQHTTTSTDMELPNLQTLSWNDPASGEVAVLVHVRRRDFVRFYDRKVESLLLKMETGLTDALQQEREGSQIKARTTAEEALKLTPYVEEAQRMLALGDVNATMDDLQMPRLSSVMKALVEVIGRLRHATAFYVHCRATINGEPYTAFEKEVQGHLAKQGCQFTDNRDMADWVIDVDASVINQDHRDGMMHFAWVDGDISVLNGTSGKMILEDRISSLEPNHYDGIKGGDNNYARAARIAYRNAAHIIAEKILKLVNE